MHELNELIDKKELFGDSWVYDCAGSEWYLLNNLSIYKKFNLKFDISGKQLPKPQNTPVKEDKVYHPTQDVNELEQVFVQDYIKLFQRQFDELLEKNLKLVNENVMLKSQMNEVKSENEIYKLETKSYNDKIEKEKYLVEMKLNDYQGLTEDLLKENQILTEQVNKTHKETNEKLERYIKENKFLNKEIEKKNKKIDELRQNIGDAEAQLDVVSEDLVFSHQKLDELKENHLKYEEEIIEKIEHVRENHESEIAVLLGKIDELTNGKDEDFNLMIQKKNDTINKLLNQNEKIKEKFKSEAQVVKKRFSDYKKVIAKERTLVKSLNDKNQQLNVVLLEEKRKAQKLEDLLEQQKQIESIQDIQFEPGQVINEEIQKKQHQNIGKLFEINNEKIWEIRGEKDYCTYLELRAKFENEEITEKTFVRKKSQWWKKVKDHSELFLEYLIKDMNGKKKVYIERKSMRAPVDLRIEFSTEAENHFTGKCLNISQGGCYLSVKDFVLYDLPKETEIKLEFIDDMLSQTFEVKAKIMSVNEEEKGLGIQFIDIEENHTKLIKGIIDDFLSELDQAA